MAKSITLTQNDTGYGIAITFIDNVSKKPIDLTGKIVNVVIKSPTGVVVDEIYGINTTNTGESKIILKKKHTVETGTYSTWWEVIDGDNQISSTQGLYYTVLSRYGE